MKPDPLLCFVFFVAGALLPIPGTLALAGLWVRGIQASLLLASLVAILAASSPWWVDWLEQRRTAAGHLQNLVRSGVTDVRQLQRAALKDAGGNMQRAQQLLGELLPPYGWTSTELPEDFRKENKR